MALFPRLGGFSLEVIGHEEHDDDRYFVVYFHGRRIAAFFYVDDIGAYFRAVSGNVENPLGRGRQSIFRQRRGDGKGGQADKVNEGSKHRQLFNAGVWRSFAAATANGLPSPSICRAAEGCKRLRGSSFGAGSPKLPLAVWRIDRKS